MSATAESRVMLVVLSDTHSRNGTRLDGRAADAVAEAETVIHAGDFVTEGALDAFYDETETLRAVHGNVDEAAVRDRLPAVRTVEYEGVRVAVAHGHEHSETGLAMLGRERDADMVAFGHSHVPGVERAGDVVLLNPGSHADPRGNPAAHAELDPADAALRGRLVEHGGSVLREFAVRTG
jgi:putative phosphoesterase